MFNRRSFLRLTGLGGLALTKLCAGPGLPYGAAQTKDKKPRSVIFTKDGFAIEGYVKQERAEIEVDPYQGVPVTIPKGFYLIDDGPRRIMFSSDYVARIARLDDRLLLDEPIKHNKHHPSADLRGVVPAIIAVGKSTGFNADWERQLEFTGLDNKPNSRPTSWVVTQHVGMITPYSVRIDTTKYFNFSSAYLIREFSAESIEGLLKSHPDYADDNTLAAAQRLKRCYARAEFMAQAGFFEKAERELDQALRDFPKEKEAIEQRQQTIGEIKARETVENIKRLALVAGQHHYAMQRIDKFPEKYASEEMKGALRGLKADYQRADKRLKEASKYFKDLAEDVSGEHQEILREAAQQISEELCFDNVNRLETFLGQAAQYENTKKDGKKPQLSAAEVLSLATSSWLLGNAAGETKPETAVRLWKTRQLILTYEKTDDINLRQKMVAAALKERTDLSQVEEAAQIVSNLPPVEPGEIDTKPMHVKAGKTTEYDLILPPEYRHGRHYPVLIVLHQSGESPREMMGRWREAAGDNGYILAAPEWESPRGGGYNYSEREHQTVLDTIRDLRRRYHVDSDRVFLFGLRDGAVMAFDVGLSHPDLFAGVSTMGAGTEKYSEIYWRNAQYLPFYVVNGDRVGKILDTTHLQFERWIGQRFPSLWVQYKGRGAEWFEGEVPLIFEWMRAKRRAFPLTQLGRVGADNWGTEFNSERPTDNSFYWLTTDEVDRLCWNGTGANFRAPGSPAQLAATIYPHEEYSDIRVKARGVSQVSVWLGRNLKGESMIDFSKPVTLRVNEGIVLNKKKVKPSLEVLLEDLYRRGDQQRVYLAKLNWAKARP